MHLKSRFISFRIYVVFTTVSSGLNSLFSCKIKSARPSPFSTDVSQDHDGKKGNALHNLVESFRDSVNFLRLQQTSRSCSCRRYHRYIIHYNIIHLYTSSVRTCPRLFLCLFLKHPSTLAGTPPGNVRFVCFLCLFLFYIICLIVCFSFTLHT